MKTPSLIAPFSIVIASLGFACGGTTFSGTNGGGGDGGSGSGSGSGGSSSSGSSSSSSGGTSSNPCPAAAPSAGAACDAAAAGVACEYGDDPNLSCDSLFTCTQGAWKATAPSTSGCPTPAASATCPATYAAAQKAGVCLDHDLECGYPQGRCECAVATGGPPSSASTPTTGSAMLPRTPPARSPVQSSETTCSTANQFCDYGACSIPDGVALRCTNGLWQTTSQACAAPVTRPAGRDKCGGAARRRGRARQCGSAAVLA